MREPQNILDITRLNPNYLGFIFYSQSARYVGEQFKMPIIPTNIQKVGVFVNQSIEYIFSKVQSYDLNLIQLHGNENPDFCKSIQLQKEANEAVKAIKIIKAFGVNEDFDFSQIANYEQFIDYILLDTKTKQYGGSGQAFDWQLLENLNTSKPIFMSGGINLENLESLFSFINSSTLKVEAIDVNSRFEISPGLKDVEKLKLLLNR
jgi:phosphoribosylanthranilate isomerase